MKYDITDDELAECNCLIDSMCWILGFLDGCMVAYLFDCCTNEKNMKHIYYAIDGFGHVFEDGDYIYDFTNTK